MAGIGFLLIGILTPIGMQYIVNTGAWGNTSSWNAAVVTVFQVLLPILYIIGAALYFIPKARGK
jgi:hypothetical protein